MFSLNIEIMFKKRSYLLVFVCCFSLFYVASAQMGGVHNYSDTSYISPRDLSQQSDFLNNKGSFPAKPRDAWQIGFFAGMPFVDGDCEPAILGVGKGIQSISHGFGVHVRKAMGYVFSIRTSAAYYNMVGLDYQPNSNLNNNPVIERLYGNAPRGYIHNHRTMAFVGSVEGLISFSNIMFHTKQKRWNIYSLIGFSGFAYNTKLNMMDGSGNRYAFEQVADAYTRGVKATTLRTMLRNMTDKSYETQAVANNRKSAFGSDWNVRYGLSYGFGLEYRMGKAWSINFEYKRIKTEDDYIDGWHRQSGDLRFAVFTSEPDNLHFGQIGANFNLGSGKKRVPPLWWLNPLEFAYADLKDNKSAIAKMFKVKDDDNDGVMNELDLEPNTPDGCPVDTHGVTADTDGDGVPDCLDKEKLTLQKCFPVDADGVGNCPEPACCDSLAAKIATCCDNKGGKGGDSKECTIDELPSIQFYGNNYKLSKDAEAILSVVAEKMKNNPNCNVKVVGYGKKTKAAQQLSWDRVNAIIRYMVEQQGISESRFIFEYGRSEDGDVLSVDLFGTMENGPNTVQPPHPQLRNSKTAKPAVKRKGVFGR